MTNPTSVRLDSETLRQTDELKAMWGDSSFTSVLRRSVQQAHALEHARRHMAREAFVAFVADVYPADVYPAEEE